MSQDYVNVTQPGADLLRLERALARGQPKNGSADQARVMLLLDPYPLEGVLIFFDVTVA
jgi:hypothetical protein